jgi:hypothetical protein
MDSVLRPNSVSKGVSRRLGDFVAVGVLFGMVERGCEG